MMRKLRAAEIGFLKKMIEYSGCERKISWPLEDLLVEEMDDGDMGSLSFVSEKSCRALGEDIAKTEFFDKDGILVLVTLSLDNYGDLFEMDVWKTDFSRLIAFPIV